MAIEMSRLQIAVDLFLGSSTFCDVSTIGILSKYTGGTLHYFPSFASTRDGVKLAKDIQRCLTRPTTFESVFRVRATRGLRVTAFYGNYFIRGSDLLALPNCTADSCFAMDLSYDEPQLSAKDVVTLQTALLYTSSSGERRIRIHNMYLPIVQVS